LSSVVRTATVHTGFWRDYEVTAELLTRSDATQPAPDLEDDLKVASLIFYVNIKEGTSFPSFNKSAIAKDKAPDRRPSEFYHNGTLMKLSKGEGRHCWPLKGEAIKPWSLQGTFHTDI
jgi:hypothetical protein